MTPAEFNALADRYVLGIFTMDRETQLALLENQETEQRESLLEDDQFDDDEKARALFLRFVEKLFARVRLRLAEMNGGGNA
jgi:hypothetical protein